MKKHFLYNLACVLCVVVAFLFLFTHRTYAITILPAIIDKEIILSKYESPYVLDQDVLVTNEGKITIEPGVNILMNNFTAVVKGNMKVEGAHDAKIKFIGTGLGMLLLENNKNTLQFKQIDFDGVGIKLSSSSASFQNVSIKNAQITALYAYKSKFTFREGSVENNLRGIDVQDKPPVLSFIEKALSLKFAWAEGNPESVIASSTIATNKRFNIQNGSVNAVDARNNWWGSIDGPGKTAIGGVLANPWLTSPLEDTSKAPMCCSSVLFLPGLESSRLYTKNIIGIENQLWEPNRNADVEKLYLDQSGQSIITNIYSRDIISETNITPLYKLPVYKSFIEDMDGLVASGTIKEWRPFPYDWRMSLEKVYADSDMANIVRTMASSSPTGKVTLVAHSNGGLLAKYAEKRLNEENPSNLIDKVILVAVPHFGTPAALFSLLYGQGQSLAGGLILKESVAQGLAKNMQSAYNLLPSTAYFNGTFDQIIKGPTSTVSTANEVSKIASPLNPTLFARSLDVHADLDVWEPHVGVDVHQIIGDHYPTISGISFVTLRNGEVDRQPVTTTRGDGTVVYISALGNLTASSTVIDILSEGAVLKKNYKHANILEFPVVENCISSLIAIGLCPKLAQASELVAGIDPDVQGSMLSGVHSPVDIGMTDNEGNFTGKVYHESSGDLEFIREDIPGSKYIEMGEGKYISVPSMQNVKTVSINGTGFGTFSYTLATSSSKGNSLSREFEDVPVTPDTVATINTAMPGTMTIDFNGDGVIDATTTDATLFDPDLYIQSIRVFIDKLIIPEQQKTALLKRLDKVSAKINKNKSAAVRRSVYKLVRSIDFQRHGHKKLTAKELTTLYDLFSKLVDGLEKL